MAMDVRQACVCMYVCVRPPSLVNVLADLSKISARTRGFSPIKAQHKTVLSCPVVFLEDSIAFVGS